MDETQTTLPEEEILPVTANQSLETLLSRISFIEEELKAPYELFEGVLSQYDEASLEKLSMQVDAESATFDHKPTERQTAHTYFNILVSSATGPEQENLRSALDFVEPLLTEADHLEVAAAELANQEFRKTKQNLLDVTDWDSVIGKHVKATDYSELRDLLSKLSSSDSEPVPLRSAIHALGNLHDWQAQFIEHGDVKTDTIEDRKPEDDFSDFNLDKDVRAWENSVASVARNYLSPKRQNFIHDIMPTKDMIQLQNLYFSTRLYTNTDSAEVPPAIKHALKQQFNKIVEDFNTKDRDFIQGDTLLRPNAIFISGQDLLKDSANIVDAPTWLHERMARHPHVLTAGLGFINFTRNASNGEDLEPENDQKSKLKNVGLMHPSSNALTVTTELAEVSKELIEDSGMSTNELLSGIQRFNKNQIGERFDHELTHYAHFHRLSVDWLQKWQGVADAETFHASKNVEDRRFEQHPHADSEDLADSTSLYYNRPAKLYTEAPQRFKILNERDGRYTQQALDFVNSKLRGPDSEPVTVEAFDIILRATADVEVAVKTNKHSNKNDDTKVVNPGE